MTPTKIIRNAIEELYGSCPPDDFIRANEWANGIDWEDVKTLVETKHPAFEWHHHNPQDLEVAEAVIFDVRHEMLQHAGHDRPPGEHTR